MSIPGVALDLGAIAEHFATGSRPGCSVRRCWELLWAQSDSQAQLLPATGGWWG